VIGYSVFSASSCLVPLDKIGPKSAVLLFNLQTSKLPEKHHNNFIHALFRIMAIGGLLIGFDRM
jgi:hypothetical protein